MATPKIRSKLKDPIPLNLIYASRRINRNMIGTQFLPPPNEKNEPFYYALHARAFRSTDLSYVHCVCASCIRSAHVSCAHALLVWSDGVMHTVHTEGLYVRRRECVYSKNCIHTQEPYHVCVCVCGTCVRCLCLLCLSVRVCKQPANGANNILRSRCTSARAHVWIIPMIFIELIRPAQARRALLRKACMCDVYLRSKCKCTTRSLGVVTHKQRSFLCLSLGNTRHKATRAHRRDRGGRQYICGWNRRSILRLGPGGALKRDTLLLE